MSDALLIFRKEWASFVGSDRGLFLVYAVFIPGWSVLIATWKTNTPLITIIWYASFSVIVAAAFSNTIFVSERISGSLEILLTCGISRSGILYGKMAFILCMTVLVGALCMGLANVLKPVLNPWGVSPAVVVGVSGIAVYCSASFLAAASSAYFSVLLPNPRILHFINLFMVMVFIFLFSRLSSIWHVPLFALAVFLTLGGVVFAMLAKKEFNSERIIKPIVL